MHQALGRIMTAQAKERWLNPAMVVAWIAIIGSVFTGVGAWNRVGESLRALTAGLTDERNDRVDWQVRHTDDTERRRDARDKAQAEDRLTSRIIAIEAAKPRTDAVMDDLQKSVNALTNAVNLLGQRLEER